MGSARETDFDPDGDGFAAASSVDGGLLDSGTVNGSASASASVGSLRASAAFSGVDVVSANGGVEGRASYSTMITISTTTPGYLSFVWGLSGSVMLSDLTGNGRAQGLLHGEDDFGTFNLVNGHIDKDDLSFGGFDTFYETPAGRRNIGGSVGNGDVVRHGAILRATGSIQHSGFASADLGSTASLIGIRFYTDTSYTTLIDASEWTAMTDEGVEIGAAVIPIPAIDPLFAVLCLATAMVRRRNCTIK